MAGLTQHKSNPLGDAPKEPLPEISEDFEELEALQDDADSDTQDRKDRFVKSTDVRRRIEERLEVRLLRDELGMDDIDLD
ncbi:MAG: hypothetical protein KJP25_10545 [Gammaproteobacteria bacterium]|nr:hypothetical protein [Gammaproteobacteria bacterium]NND39564.1 hypothetical protein [Pseudomonadales bacterium]MBT8151761.1 hypothetical protein [Gammaproteobacteria bacterium]NNL11446.1 hypothetical protein [Pseudomonadales bacterium]NNM12601.1 hypothetical protein [Pseudomonadales bacterium]